MSVSVAASEQALPQVEASAETVLISAESIRLLSTIRGMAVGLGYEVEEVDGGARGSKTGTSNLLLHAVDPEKALKQLLKRTNHLIEYEGNPPRVRRAVVLDIGEADSDLFQIVRSSEEQLIDTPTHHEDGSSVDEVATESDRTVRTFELQSLDPEDAIARLETVLGAKQPDMREWAINGLGEFGVRGHQRAVLALGQVLFSDPLPSIRVSAVNWLRSIQSDASLVFVDAARNDTSDHVREAANGG